MNDFIVERWKKLSKPSFEEIVEMMKGEGLEPATFEVPKKVHFGEHTHDHHEIRIVVSGRMKFGVHGTEITLFPGDRIEVPAGTEHWAEALENSKLLSATRD